MNLRLVSIGILASAAMTNQLMEWQGIYVYPFHHYLDDLLAVPLALGFFHLIHIFLRHNDHYTLSVPVMLTAVLGFSVHFELLMPLISARYTADGWDVAMYLAGGLLYALLLNRPLLYKFTKHFSA